MAYTYCLRKDRVRGDRLRKYTVYGVDAKDENGKVLQSYPDIFFDKAAAKEFVNLCNENELELIHLSDVLEDMLV